MNQKKLPRWFEVSDANRGLEQEMMTSDRLRAGILCAFFLAAALFVLIAWTQAWRFSGPLTFLRNFPWPMALAAAIVVGLYEAGYRIIQGLLMARGLRFPLPPRLLNALIEVSVPTLLLYWLSTVVPPETALNLPTVFLYFLFLALSTLRLEPAVALFTGIVAGAEYAGLAWLLLSGSSSGLIQDFVGLYFSKGMLMVATGLVSAFVTYQIRSKVIRLLEAQDQRAKIASIFGQHVSPAVMEKLLAQKVGQDTETRHVTVMFLDIRNFTTFSETRSPDEVVDYLNRLFSFMVDAVNGHQGIINKFLGDGFMAVFGAPLDDGRSETNALKASLEISDRLAVALAEGLEPTRIGIGLHSGRAVTGNVGSAQRREYTLIGDVVNLASRIESQTKNFGAEILVSEEVWSAAVAQGEAGLPAGQPLGEVSVKGRDVPVRLVKVR